jgi:hypothetical protein
LIGLQARAGEGAGDGLVSLAEKGLVWLVGLIANYDFRAFRKSSSEV